MEHPEIEPRIKLAHGSGGKLTHDLIHDLFVHFLGNPQLTLNDAAHLSLPQGRDRLAMTTDSFVVSPLFFNGGDIGSLAVNGTVNDLAVSGAEPRYLSLAAIIEEGFPLSALERVVQSIAEAAKATHVSVVAGDTKVVERGKGDGLFLNTTGIGLMRPGYPRTDRSIHAGDAIMVSGPLGDHGAVVLAARSGIEPENTLISDCAPVTRLVETLFATDVSPLFMRDPTRGGLAGVLCDLAGDFNLSLEISEANVPVRPAVTAICEIVGVDPFHLACEGRILACIAAEEVERAIAAWKALPAGADAMVIGHIVGEKRPGQVVVKTRYGGARRIVRPTAELLPRIC